MSVDNNKSKNQNILILVMLSVIIVVICSLSFGLARVYKNAANASIEENAKDILVQSTINIANYTDTRLTSSLNTLSGYAVSFTHAEEMTETQINDCVQHCLEDGNFSEIAYVNIAGIVFGQRYDRRCALEAHCGICGADADRQYCPAAVQHGGQRRGGQVCG